MIGKQFTIKTAFTTTNNNKQGQKLEWTGLYLPQTVFSLVYLYAAFTQVRRFSYNYVCDKDTYSQTDDHIRTANIV